MRIRLGPASRAVVQCGMTFTRRERGTSPFTAPGMGVGRFSGLIGLTAPAGARPNIATATNTGPSTSILRTRLIQSPVLRRAANAPRPEALGSGDGVQPPVAGNALELVGAAVRER